MNSLRKTNFSDILVLDTGISVFEVDTRIESEYDDILDYQFIVLSGDFPQSDDQHHGCTNVKPKEII